MIFTQAKLETVNEMCVVVAAWEKYAASHGMSMTKVFADTMDSLSNKPSAAAVEVAQPTIWERRGFRLLSYTHTHERRHI